ncbi:MAG: hypothetical protein ACTSPD_20490 [Promethearchaeota archaeon]
MKKNKTTILLTILIFNLNFLIPISQYFELPNSFIEDDKNQIEDTKEEKEFEQDEIQNMTALCSSSNEPDVSISNVRCTDDHISFDYSIESNIPSGHGGGLVEVILMIYCPSKNAWRWSDISLNYRSSYSGTYSQDMLVHVLWPVIGGWYSVGDLYNWGNRDITVSVQAIQHHWLIWPFAVETEDSSSQSVTMVDDDSNPPNVNAYLYTFGHTEQIQNGLTYDIHEIPYSESHLWTLRIEASDQSGVQWKGLYGDDPDWHPMPGGFLETSLKSIIDTFPDSNLIRFGAKFKDMDNDRSGDYSDETTFEFKFLRQKPWYAPSYEGLADIKIDGEHHRNGIILAHAQYITTDYPFDYKKDGEKNKVKFKVHFTNTEDYPIRIKLGVFISSWENVIVSVNNDFIYKYESNSDDHYEGDLSPEDVFESDDKIDEPGNYYFWIEIPSGFDGDITLFTICVESLTLINNFDWLLLQDIIDIAFEIFNFAMVWQKAPGDTGGSGAYYGLAGDLIQDIISWIIIYTKFQDALENKGGFLPILFNVKEAFVAKKALDNKPYKWIWNLTRDDMDIGLDAPQHYSEDYDNSKLDGMILESDYVEFNEVTGSYYAGIGFHPNQHQEDALWAFLYAEIFSDICYMIAKLAFIIYADDPVEAFVVALLFEFFGIALDLGKWGMLDIANGADPPDNNYFAKPDVERVEIPYEDFPEIQTAPDSPFLQESKEFIDLLVEQEKIQTDLTISNNRYNTAISDENYIGAKVQLDYRQEILNDLSSTSAQLDNQFKNVMNEFELYTNNDPLYFTDEELNIIASHDQSFIIDGRLSSYVETYSDIRDLDKDFLLADIQAGQNKVNSYELEDLTLLNSISPHISNSFDVAESTTETLKKENADMNEYIWIEKLGEEPASDDEISSDLDYLEGQLSILIDSVSNGNYYSSIILANAIKEDSLNLYYETYREEFFEIYSTAESIRRYAEQANQINLELVDSTEKSVKNGAKVNVSINIRNIVSDAILNKQDEILPILYIPDLPAEISYKIFHQGVELERNLEGNYKIPIKQNEIKNLKLELTIAQNSPLEMNQIPITLIASENTLEKYMYFETQFVLEVLDDDELAPEVENLEINTYDDMINIYFEAYDESGLENIDIYIDDIFICSYQPLLNENSFDFYFINAWVFEYGTHQVRLEITDSDNDRENDDEILILTESFEITAKEMMEYVLWEIDELKDYIDHNVFFLYDWVLINQLNSAGSKVQCALNWYNTGAETKPVILDKLAKSNLDLLDILTTILDDWGLISEEDGDYISAESHKIRDHITLSMGAIVGTEPALETANIIIDIEKLADKIYDEQNLWVALSIDIHLWQAADNLDNALITMSMDMVTIPLILDDISKANLKLADVTTFLWEEIGCMSEVDSDYISQSLHSIRDRITLTMGHIVGTDIAEEIALIEVDIEQFADQIFDSHDLYTALAIDLELWMAAEFLDLALISLSAGSTCGAEANLQCAISQLECAKGKVNDLKNSGHLTEEQAAQIQNQIDGFIVELTALCDHSQSEGYEEGSTDTNLHSDTDESNGGSSDSSGSNGDTSDPNTDVPTH